MIFRKRVLQPHARTKVVRLITGLTVGGPEMGLLESLRHLDRTRFEFSVACLYDRGRAADEIERLGVPVSNMRMRWFSDPVGLLRLWCFLRAEKPAILHTHLFRASLWGRLFGYLQGIPVILSTVHGATQSEIEGRRRTWLISAVDAISARCCDRILAVSEAVRSSLIENHIQPDKVELMLNAIDTEAFAAGDGKAFRDEFDLSGAPLVSMVARLHPDKNHQMLIDAFARVRAAVPEAKLLIVGSGALEGELRIQAASLGDSVIFTGDRKDIPAVMAASDVVVLCSRHETFGKTLAEAMAAGRPAVATAVDGIPEVVVDGVTGLLVPPGDVEALARAVVRLLRDRELGANLGAAGRARAREHFDSRRSVGRLQQLYDELYMGKIASGCAERLCRDAQRSA
jgi:glycosyltransferase involved in cell wall biosynthesis